jgi:hypothetical protein
MKSFSKIAVLILGLAFASSVTRADPVSLTLTGNRGASNGTDYIYPHYFSINGSGRQTSQLGDGTYSNNDIQEAVWNLSASNPGSVPTTSDDAALLLAASNAVTLADLRGTSAFDDGQFTLYTSVPGSQTSKNGTPQTFIGVTPVPEFGSLLLLASGLFGCAILYRRRRVKL